MPALASWVEGCVFGLVDGAVESIWVLRVLLNPVLCQRTDWQLLAVVPHHRHSLRAPSRRGDIGEQEVVLATWLVARRGHSRKLALYHFPSVRGTGENSCQWRSWFQTHNQLTEKRADDFDMVGWQIDRSRLLTGLVEEVARSGLRPLREQSLKCIVASCGATVSGKADCLVVNGSQIDIYDCKTGKSRPSDQRFLLHHVMGLYRSSWDGEVCAWGPLGDFKRGLELLRLSPPGLDEACQRLLLWVDDRLFALAPLPSRHKWRYLRFRCLRLSG